MKDKTKNKLKKQLNKFSENQKYEKGIEKLNSFLDKNPEFKNDEWILYKLGFFYDHFALEKAEKEKKELEEKALKFYKRILDQNPKSIKGIWGIGRIYWHREDEKALKYAKKAYKIHKEKTGSESFSNEVALVYKKLGNVDKAEQWLLRGLEEIKKNDHLKPTYANFIQFYDDIGKIKEAKKYAYKLNDWYKKQPDSFKDSKSGKELSKLINKFIN